MIWILYYLAIGLFLSTISCPCVVVWMWLDGSCKQHTLRQHIWYHSVGFIFCIFFWLPLIFFMYGKWIYQGIRSVYS